MYTMLNNNCDRNEEERNSSATAAKALGCLQIAITQSTSNLHSASVAAAVAIWTREGTAQYQHTAVQRSS